MVILLTGATGFIGRPLGAALVAAGHEVVAAVRDVAALRRSERRLRPVHADFTRDFALGDWLPRLKDVDAVVNAVGILRERGPQTFDALHWRAPMALFAACEVAGVPRVVQVSALGADAAARSRYHLTKKAADDFLLDRVPGAVVAQPSLVYGPGGTSARLFTTLASLPLIPLPGGGRQPVQPIHRDDLVAALLLLTLSDAFAGERVPLVGPQPVLLRELLGALRVSMRLGAPTIAPVPMPLARAAAAVAGVMPGVPLDRETLQMLERGNVASAEPTQALLGRPPRPVQAFVPPREAAAVRTQARLGWLLPVLRVSVAAVWLVAGAVSLGLYPVAASYELLARAGVTGVLAPLALYGAATLDLVFGVATLAWRRRALWLAQIAVVLAYTAMITWHLPEFWLHPYGPVVKNLPFLAVLWLLYEFEDR